MSSITDIRAQKRHKEWYNIYIDDEFAFSIQDELIVRYNLKIGMEVDQDSLKKMVAENNRKKAFDRALGYLSHNMHTEKQVTQYLEGKGFDDKSIDYAIEKLKEYDLVDDMQYAVAWIKNSIVGKPKGKRMLMYELGQKGIPDTIARLALDTMDEDTEKEQAKKLADKYMKKYTSLDDRRRRQKVGQAMARRGFDWEIIRWAIDNWADE
ncbi:MAG: RecX family transcriptional regulator [Xylanivirga thermophila]|jgi:regulatory protein|uniref:RecX family transcriptional regulator n=1 Tax=Xylanivirga thermophila TaxID=2496273 RepID=UPI00101C8298|nr:RecX family transcriptional regulator [Xylanivirga thermophila]